MVSISVIQHTYGDTGIKYKLDFGHLSHGQSPGYNLTRNALAFPVR